ncbi:MAG: FCD domain-containing protein [Asticcacaulis sp.]|uniref:FCD domain-containing protein n=1 Tax=Asticcacaulis sp. TaxID=1872648 RepID=UPI003F7CAC0D
MDEHAPPLHPHPRERRAYQDIGEDLIRRIRAREFDATGRLPPERELAQGYDVGRTVIRDALVMLEVKGLIEPRHGSGIYITPLAFENAAPSETRLTDAHPPAGPFELLQARQWLESHIARLAAQNAGDDDIRAIEQAYEGHRAAAFGEPKEGFDSLFHTAIAQATQNNELVLLVEQLRQRRHDNPLWRRLHEHIKDKRYRDRWVRDHDRIVDALRRRDGDAAYVAMWSHIENVKTFLSNWLGADELDPPTRRKRP